MINNHDIVFDISDPTLTGKDFKFFYDQSLTEVFENNGIDSEFVVTLVVKVNPVLPRLLETPTTIRRNLLWR